MAARDGRRGRGLRRAGPFPQIDEPEYRCGRGRQGGRELRSDGARRGQSPRSRRARPLSMTLERTLAVLPAKSERHPAARAVPRSCRRTAWKGIFTSPLSGRNSTSNTSRSSIGPANRCLASEALVRWRKRGTENVPPSVFVPEAERNGFIHELGEWVLRRACRDALAWPGLARRHQRIAGAISPRRTGGPNREDLG